MQLDENSRKDFTVLAGKIVSNYDELDDPVSKKMQDACKSLMAPPEIRLLQSGCALPSTYLKYAERIREMEVRSDDVWLCAYPKCGITWTQEMVWLLGNGLNFERAKSEQLHERVPFLEFTGMLRMDLTGVPDSVTSIENRKSPRFIKSHLPLSLLPKQLFEVNPKIIFVMRNPKDAAVSYFHHFQIFNNYTGTLNDFMEAFLEEKVIYSPYWEYILSFWNLRNKENVLITSFEDMKADLSKVIRRTADFLGVTYTKEQDVALLEHLSFKNMKNNPMVNKGDKIKELGKQNMHFIRNGEVGSWKKEMDPEIAEKFDSWTKEKIKRSDFPYYLNA